MQVGAGPPFQNPPVRDLGSAFGASLQACRPGLAIPGRRTQTPGRSPCFRRRTGGPSPLAGEVGWGGSGLMSISARTRVLLLAGLIVAIAAGGALAVLAYQQASATTVGLNLP